MKNIDRDTLISDLQDEFMNLDTALAVYLSEFVFTHFELDRIEERLEAAKEAAYQRGRADAYKEMLERP